MRFAATLWGLGVSLALTAAPDHAAACSCSGAAIQRSDPDSGALDVELNAQGLEFWLDATSAPEGKNARNGQKSL